MGSPALHKKPHSRECGFCFQFFFFLILLSIRVDKIVSP